MQRNLVRDFSLPLPPVVVIAAMTPGTSGPEPLVFNRLDLGEIRIERVNMSTVQVFNVVGLASFIEDEEPINLPAIDAHVAVAFLGLPGRAILFAQPLLPVQVRALLLAAAHHERASCTRIKASITVEQATRRMRYKWPWYAMVWPSAQGKSPYR